MCHRVAIRAKRFKVCRHIDAVIRTERRDGFDVVNFDVADAQMAVMFGEVEATD